MKSTVQLCLSFALAALLELMLFAAGIRLGPNQASIPP
jgi:hypothetical protein